MTSIPDPLSCVQCVRRCGADRASATARPGCGIGGSAKVHSWGNGAILFAGCSLRCLNCPIAAAAWNAEGGEVTADGLAEILLALDSHGAGPILLDNPGHVTAQVARALGLASTRGMTATLAWRSAAVEAPEALASLAGRIDLYMPEVKFGDDRVARQIAGVNGYVAANRAAVAEMLRQVGPLTRDADGRPVRGVLVRHQILPGGLAGTAQALAALPTGTAVRISGAYVPVHRARQHPVLARAVTKDEVAKARDLVWHLGLVEV